MSRIILGVTGSIAAYKAADLASQLTKAGHGVTCVLTKSALEFVTPLTLGTLSKNPVITDLFAEKEGWQPGHIHTRGQGGDGIAAWVREEFVLLRGFAECGDERVFTAAFACNEDFHGGCFLARPVVCASLHERRVLRTWGASRCSQHEKLPCHLRPVDFLRA